MEVLPISKNQMIRELEQVKFLLENINENLRGKTSEKYDFQKKTPSLKQSKKEMEQEKILLEYIGNHLTPETKIEKMTTDLQKKSKSLTEYLKETEQEKILLKYVNKHLTTETKIGKKTTDLQKKSKSLTQSLKEIEQEKLILNVINNQLMTDDSKYKDILDTLTTEFKTPLIPIKIYSKSLLEGEFGDLSQTQKEKLKMITKNTDMLLGMISELLVSKNIDKVKTMFSTEELHRSLEKIVTKNVQIKEQENILHFSEQIKLYTVGIIDIVGSTNITANLSEKNIGDFYSIFINDISNIIKKLEGIVVKNIGDSLLFYFPNTLEKSHKNANQKSVENAIKCGFALIDYHSIINKKMSELGLPKLDYKISFSFGRIRVAKIITSAVDDIFGPAINICSKINSSCPPNSIVVTQKFHNEIDSFDWLQSEKLFEYCTPNEKIQIYLIKKTA
ncbi:MAG: adenylate/guanylate cyclase domain-containing protein [Nitrosopumilus sp.]